MISSKNVASQYAPFSDAPEVLREFLNYMLTIRGRSPRTVDGYYIEIRTFLRYLKLSKSGNLTPDTIETFRQLPIRDVTLDMIRDVQLFDVYAYLNFVHTQFGNDACSRARKTTALRTFYRYLSTKANYLQDNPLKNLETPAIKKSLPKYLTLEQSRELLTSAAPQNHPQESSSREYCILTLFLNCGMRLSELVGINLEDIRDDRTLHLLGKGNKERTVYLNDACLDAIQQYLADTTDVKRQDHALFVGRNGKRLSPRRVEQLVDQSLKNAGLSQSGITPHKLRHTAATLMYQYGQVDIRILKELLGHVSLSTTEIYTHVSNTQLEEASFRSPLSQFGQQTNAERLDQKNLRGASDGQQQKIEQHDGAESSRANLSASGAGSLTEGEAEQKSVSAGKNQQNC
jgi:site-specific recombinase XerD